MPSHLENFQLDGSATMDIYAQDDPFDWGIERVIAEVLQNQSPPWIESSSASGLSHPFIVTSFRDNDINGEVLLSAISREELQRDLGVKSLGQRHLILKAIRFLQNRSRKYQENFPQQHGNAAYHSPQTTYSAQSALQSSTGPYSTDSRANSPRFANDFYESHIIRQPPPPLFTRITTVERSLEHDESGLSDTPSTALVSHERNLDPNIEAADLERPAVSETTKDVRAQVERSDAAPSDRILGAAGKSQRRIVPLLIGPVGSHVNKEVVPSRHGLEGRRNGLPTPIEDVFYPIDVVDDGPEFFFAEKLPNERRRFIHKAIHHFLRQPVERLKDSSMLYRIPYSHHSTRRSSRFFTMFPSGASPLIQDTSNWPILESKKAKNAAGLSVKDRLPGSIESIQDEEVESDGYFNALLEKYPPNNFDESETESEDDVSLDDETWAEIQQEAEENSARVGAYLSPSEVSRIIDETIEAYIEDFKETKSQKLQTKSFKLWGRATVLGRRRIEKAATEAQAEYLTTKIETGKSEIGMHTWKKSAELKFQCQSLQEHINQREEAIYLSKVLSSLIPPPRPRIQSTHRRPKIHENLPEDEEVLESESEMSLDDFIVNDEDKALDAEMADDEMDEVDFQPATDQTPVAPTSAATPHRRSGSAATGRKKLSHEPLSGRGSTTTSNSLPTLSGSDQDLDDLPPILPDTRYKQTGHDEASAIQLSSDYAAPEDSSATNPVSSNSDDGSVRPRTPATAHEPRHRAIKNTSPDLDDLEAIQALKLKDLESRSDRKRLLVKLIVDLQTEDKSRLRDYVTDLKNQTEMAGSIKIGIEEMLSQSRANSSDNGSNDLREIRTIELLLARLYISYDKCKAFRDWKAIPSQMVASILNRLDALKTFCETLKLALDKGREKMASERLIQRTKKIFPKIQPQEAVKDLPDTESTQAEDEFNDTEVSDQDMLGALTGTPHKQRKREVKESQEALQWQKEDARRVQDFERRRDAAMTIADSSEQSRPLVSFSDVAEIRLDPHIGFHAKPHQVGGIQFMWREIVDNKKQQGCLLAHTMGLGKTMQVIAFLSTLNQAARSSDPKVRSQVPERLRQSKTLILAPASLVQNWVEEFAIWQPKGARLGQIRHFSGSSLQARIRTLNAWSDDGGVLLSSYEMFRDMILKQQKLTEEQHEDVKRRLLSPNIIVADEAHKMKNSLGKLFIAASSFASKSRIALTGSPLANNLEEYYTMIQWVAPGYLGELVQFKAKYSEPIAQGLYQDSSRTEKRTSLRRLHLLKKNLEPKTHRADISAIAADMPQKTEFFLTVSLSDVQIKAYKAFVVGMIGGNRDVDKLSNAKVFSWLALLTLLCNHPVTLKNRLISAVEKPRSSTTGPSATDMQDASADNILEQRITYSDIPLETLEEQLGYFRGINDLSDVRYSAKAALIDSIIRQSVAIGDKVLLFSHSLLALDYYQKLMELRGVKYTRLDGTTKVTSRQSDTRRFNRVDNKMMVYLISIRAGGLGLNLPGANRVIILDFNFNPTWEEQAIGRAYRLGQKKPVFVYRFRAGGTYEEIVYNKTVFKTQLSARVVDDKSWASYATKKAKEYIFEPREIQQHDLSDSYGKDPNVLDTILDADDHGIRNIELTETFQREDDEQLTAEELKQVQQELDDENMMRDDPAAYRAKQNDRWRAEEEARRKAPHALHQAISSHLGSAVAPSQEPGFTASRPETTTYSFRSILRDAGENSSFGESTLDPQHRAPTPELSAAEPYMSTFGAFRPRGNSDPAELTPLKRPHPSSYDGANDARLQARSKTSASHSSSPASASDPDGVSLQQSSPSINIKQDLATPIVEYTVIDVNNNNIIELSSDSDRQILPPSKKQKLTGSWVAEQENPAPLAKRTIKEPSGRKSPLSKALTDEGETGVPFAVRLWSSFDAWWGCEYYNVECCCFGRYRYAFCFLSLIGVLLMTISVLLCKPRFTTRIMFGGQSKALVRYVIMD